MHALYTSLSLLLLPLLIAASPENARAQDYPQKTVRIVVPYPPGGGVDTVARIVGQKLAADWGREVLIDNRSGAAGSIGAGVVAKAPPDGYTLLLAPSGPWLWGPMLRSLAPHMYHELPFDPQKDFAAVTMVSSGPYVLVVNPSIPATSVQELVALAKSQPGKLSFASAGSGSPVHLAGELFKNLAKVDILHVPYKGSATAISDLLGGRVSMAFQVLPLTLAHTSSGKLRALAVTTDKRFPSAPEIPTMKEAGLPGVDITQWSGLFAPAGTANAVLTTLRRKINGILEREDVRQLFLAQGFQPVVTAPEEFGSFLEKEIRSSATLIRDSGVRIE